MSMQILGNLLDMGSKRRSGTPAEVGRRIKDARTKAGLTQQQLAAQAHITQGTLSSLERGDTKNPEADTILRLAISLRVTPYYLLWDHHQPENMEPNHAFMVDLWNLLDDYQKGQVIGYAQALVEVKPKPTAEPKSAIRQQTVRRRSDH